LITTFRRPASRQFIVRNQVARRKTAFTQAAPQQLSVC
jgi:hypothetical protein